MVVILAAGYGSRMDLEPGISKCSVKLPDGRTSVRRLIDQFMSLGEKYFTVIIGYGAQSVIEGVGSVVGAHVYYIYNEKYKTRGCEYSLSCSAPLIKNQNLFIVEGDLVTDETNLRALYDNNNENQVLVRPSSFLSKSSVAVLCHDQYNFVEKFFYDQLHAFDMEGLSRVKPRLNVYDSFQVWKIKSEDVEDFRDLLLLYHSDANLNDESLTEDFKYASGLLSLNRFIESHRMFPTLAPRERCWVNLNSQKDIENLTKCTWFIKEES